MLTKHNAISRQEIYLLIHPIDQWLVEAPSLAESVSARPGVHDPPNPAVVGREKGQRVWLRTLQFRYSLFKVKET
jgi:hypothetical protein